LASAPNTRVFSGRAKRELLGRKPYDKSALPEFDTLCPALLEIQGVNQLARAVYDIE